MSGIRFARVPTRAAGMSLGATPLRVLIAIAGHADADGRAFPGMGAIAAETGIRRQDVPRAVAALEQAGLLKRERAAGGGRSTTVYVILFAAGEMSAPQQTQVSATQRTECPQESVLSVRNTADQTKYNKPNTSARTRVRARKVSQVSASEDFEHFWRIYPSRGRQTNPKKPARERFEALVKSSVDPKRLLLAASNYRDAMLRSGKFGSEFVMQAMNFLGRDRRWEQFADPDDQPEFALAVGMI